MKSECSVLSHSNSLLTSDTACSHSHNTQSHICHWPVWSVVQWSYKAVKDIVPQSETPTGDTKMRKAAIKNYVTKPVSNWIKYEWSQQLDPCEVLLLWILTPKLPKSQQKRWKNKNRVKNLS